MLQMELFLHDWVKQSLEEGQKANIILDSVRPLKGKY